MRNRLRYIKENPRTILLLYAFLCVSTHLSAEGIQRIFKNSSVSAQIQSEIQYCFKDSTNDPNSYANKFLSHTYLDGSYNSDILNAGLRFEMYENPLPGFESSYKGQGIPYFHLTLQLKKLTLTGGDFYEQFGSGLLLRTYQERSLGIDNALRGGRILYTPFPWMRIKAVAGFQRNQWDWKKNWVKGIDLEVEMDEWLLYLKDRGQKLLLGGSFVSKHEQDELILTSPNTRLHLPQQIGAFSTRIEYQAQHLTLRGEYAWKANDPNTDNQFIYRPGQALLLSASWSQQGLGVTLAAKHCDNMSLRSTRTGTGNAYQLNYLPAFTRQHTYALAALYPYATQLDGEVAFQADLFYKFKKGSLIGGRYGMDIRLNYSQTYAPKRKYPAGSLTPVKGTYGYTTSFFSIGNECYYRDVNIELSRKINSDLQLTVLYMNQLYNLKVQGKQGLLHAHIGVSEILYKLSSNLVFRGELQYLTTKQDQKDWGAALMELSVSPHWIFTLSDLYNLGGEKKEHFPLASLAYSLNAHRIQLTAGRQRAGYNCAGGICRYVPETKGVSLTYTANF